MSKIKWDKVPDYLVWNRVKSLRKSMALSQTQLAAGSDVSMATIYHIEQGYDQNTTKETRQKLANFFKCDISDIFPSQMKGDSPVEMPKSKNIIKLQYFISEEKK